ncbi:MAG TPA: winged helix-turn-helix domain-containing protein [Candidatus Hodarchaeales archaeon]|nr:winged helix-turn-helix domain-containing protein [Candidatus Hodarchaeales archaeon]
MRPKILLLIESEGRIGYKDLRAHLGIAIGTLYHHLRTLEGFVEQDQEKRYFLTERGIQALNFLLQGEVQRGTSIPTSSSQANVATGGQDHQDSSPLKARAQAAKDFYYKLYQLPKGAVTIALVMTLPLSIALLIVSPAVTFFNFVPVQTDSTLSGFVPLVWMAITLCLILTVSLSSDERLSISSWGWLSAYFDVYMLVSLTMDFNEFLTSTLAIHLVSLLFQGLFVLTWAAVLSMQYWSWERGVLTALVINFALLSIALL